MSTQEALAPLAESRVQAAFTGAEPSQYRCQCGCARCSPGVPDAAVDLAAMLGRITPEAEAEDAWIWRGFGRRG